MSAVDHAVGRLMAVFNPPDTPDPAAFMAELKVALGGMSSDALADGVSEIIRTRRHRSFPSIGDVRQACLDVTPRASSAPERRDMGAVFREEDDRRDDAIRMLAHHPQIDRLIACGKHASLYDYIMRTGELPATRTEWDGLQVQFEKVERLLSEADGEAQIGADGKITLWWDITRKAADAIRERRAELATKISNLRRMAAE